MVEIKTEATTKLLKNLEIENKKADAKSAEVNKTTEECLQQRNTVEAEKAQPMEELKAALPFLEKAKAAVDSIRQADIAELKTLRKEATKDIIKIIFDTVQLLFMGEMVPVSPKTV